MKSGKKRKRGKRACGRPSQEINRERVMRTLQGRMRGLQNEERIRFARNGIKNPPNFDSNPKDE